MKQYLTCVFILIAICGLCTFANGQTTEFTYQGNLVFNGQPATGNYDFEFSLHDTLDGQTQIGSTISRSNVAVVDGVFSVGLDFGNVFDAVSRFLKIRVRVAGTAGYTELAPRSRITRTPTAIHSLKAIQADTALSAQSAVNTANLGGVAANQYVVTSDPRLSDSRNPLPNSANYVQNRTTEQVNANFYISGFGRADVFSAATHYSLDGARVLHVSGTRNLFVGRLSGAQPTTGTDNAFFGYGAGSQITSGIGNTFFGSTAGQSTSTENYNSFFGFSAGISNGLGAGNPVGNSFFGAFAGKSNQAGSENAFFGTYAGENNIIGLQNSILGYAAGRNNISDYGSFFGYQAGRDNQGASNSFFGHSAGMLNTTGSGNTFIGIRAGEGNLTGSSNAFLGALAGRDSLGNNNVFIGSATGRDNGTGSNNAFVGSGAGNANSTGSHITLLGFYSDVSSSNLSYATAIGAGAVVTFSDTIQLGRDNLDSVRIGRLGSNGTTAVCLNGVKGFATCSSSLKYKYNINDYRPATDLIERLRPVTFQWKAGNALDLGLVAEEVAAIDPLLVTYNDKGEVEGVKYDRIGVVLINVIKEQQKLIEKQDRELTDQSKKIEQMRLALCRLTGDANFCDSK